MQREMLQSGKFKILKDEGSGAIDVSLQNIVQITANIAEPDLILADHDVRSSAPRSLPIDQLNDDWVLLIRYVPPLRPAGASGWPADSEGKLDSVPEERNIERERITDIEGSTRAALVGTQLGNESSWLIMEQAMLTACPSRRYAQWELYMR
jgi:hypothetical protein